MIVDRREMRDKLAALLTLLQKISPRSDPGEFGRLRRYPHRRLASDWLAHIERLHAQPSSSAWNACARSNARSAPRKRAGHHRRRHQRQGLHLRHARAHPARAGYRVGCTPRRTCSITTSACASTAARPPTRRCARLRRASRPRAAKRRSPISSSARWRPGRLFAAAGVDVVILEVGLGGRLDAVNVFDADCAIVTSSTSTTWTTSGPRARRSASRRPASSVPAGRPSSAMRSRRKACSSMRRTHRRRPAGAGRDFGYLPGRGAMALLGRRGAPRRTGLSGAARRQPAGQCQHGDHRAGVRCATAAGVDAGHPPWADRRSSCPGASRCCRAGRRWCWTSPTTRRRPACWPTISAAWLSSGNLGGVRHAGRQGHRRRRRARQGACRPWLVAGLPGPRGMSRGRAGADICGEQGLRVDGRFDNPADAYRAAKERAGEDDRIAAFGSFLTVAGVLQAIDDERKRRTT
jgi:dihydrofolate synthase/folylpolyglutamate synthase